MVLEDYGDILVATVGLLSILISYYLSWKYIAKNNLKNSNSFKRGAPLMRYLAMGVFDKISFAAFLLELYRKTSLTFSAATKIFCWSNGPIISHRWKEKNAKP